VRGGGREGKGRGGEKWKAGGWRDLRRTVEREGGEGEALRGGGGGMKSEGPGGRGQKGV